MTFVDSSKMKSCNSKVLGMYSIRFKLYKHFLKRHEYRIVKLAYSYSSNKSNNSYVGGPAEFQ